MIEVAVGILLLLGSGFSFIAALGVVRLPDVLIRMHASTKAGTLGCSLIALGAALWLGGDAWARAVLITLFFLLTAPLAAHMIGRAALRTGVPLWRMGPDGVPHGEQEEAAPGVDLAPDPVPPREG